MNPKSRILCAVSSRPNSTHPRWRRGGAGQPADSGQSLRHAHADKRERRRVVPRNDKIILLHFCYHYYFIRVQLKE